MDFSISVDIAAPPERVWAIMSDIEHWSDWTASVTSITRLEAGPLGPGSRARIRQAGLPPAFWKVVSLEPNRNFTWVTRAPGVTVTAHHGVEPAGPGTRAMLSLNFSGVCGGLVGRLTRGINERYLQMEAAGLKKRSEERAP